MASIELELNRVVSATALPPHPTTSTQREQPGTLNSKEANEPEWYDKRGNMPERATGRKGKDPRFPSHPYPRDGGVCLQRKSKPPRLKISSRRTSHRPGVNKLHAVSVFVFLLFDIDTASKTMSEETEYVWDKEIAVPASLIQYIDEGVRERTYVPTLAGLDVWREWRSRPP